MKGFKEFLLRGNVIDLAVAVVVGTTFTLVVNSLVNSVLNPAIGALFKAESLSELWQVEIPTTDGGVAVIAFGAVAAALLQFLLVAIVVYFFLILPINLIKERAARKKAEGNPEPELLGEVELLTEIRDLLKAQSAARDSDATR